MNVVRDYVERETFGRDGAIKVRSRWGGMEQMGRNGADGAEWSRWDGMEMRVATTRREMCENGDHEKVMRDGSLKKSAPWREKRNGRNRAQRRADESVHHQRVKETWDERGTITSHALRAHLAS